MMSATLRTAAPNRLTLMRTNPWVSFAIRRVGRLLVSMWVLLTAVFLMIHLVPGDPVRASLGTSAPASLVAARREALGLNHPLLVQYGDYVKGLFSGKLGSSIQSNLPVSQLISGRITATAEIAVLAFVVVMIVSVPVGTLMAVLTRGGRRRGGELTFTFTNVVLAAIPEFVLAVVLEYLLSVRLGWLPVAGRSGPSSYVLPVVSLAVGPAAVLTRIVRVEVLAVLGQDFIRTARSKRLPARLIYGRHALPNALTATLTLAGLALTGLIAGTVLVENVFDWPGLGYTLVQSILSKDYPVVQGIVLIYGAFVLLVNLIVDVLLAVLDPRSTIREY